MAEENVKPVKAKKAKSARFKNFAKGIFVENPLFVMVLGTCPALATTTSLEAALGMGILFSIVLVCSNVIISSLRKLIPDEVRTPAYIVIIATFVTIVKMLTNAFLPPLYATLGVFISLIVVNCIVLGRAEAFASKNTVLDSLLDGLGMGLGYTLALLTIAFFREVIGSGMITFGKIFYFIPLTQIPVLKYCIYISDVRTVAFDFSIPLLQLPAGAFIVFGIVMAFIGFMGNRKSERAAFMKRLKTPLVPVEDDKRVKLMRILFMVGVIFVALFAFDMMFVDPVTINGVAYNWHHVYLGKTGINGAIPAFLGFIMMLVAMILAGVAIIFYKKWNNTYIWLAIASGLLFIISGCVVLTTANIFAKVNPSLNNVSLGAGPIAGGVLSILAGATALGGLIITGIVDSNIVRKQQETKEVAQ